MTDNSSDEAQRREHLRISLRLGNDADFLLDCDGMTVQLGHWHWWRPGKLGLGNIKDISRGGVGLISASRLHQGMKLKLLLNDDLVLPISITHCRQLYGPLWFYGGRYLELSTEDLYRALRLVQQHRRKLRQGRRQPVLEP